MLADIGKYGTVELSKGPDEGKYVELTIVFNTDKVAMFSTFDGVLQSVAGPKVSVKIRRKESEVGTIKLNVRIGKEIVDKYTLSPDTWLDNFSRALMKQLSDHAKTLARQKPTPPTPNSKRQRSLNKVYADRLPF